MMDFTDKIVLITGASRGFGFAAGLAFASAGAHVVAVARTVGGLEDLDDAIQKAGGAATLVPLDLLDDAGLERMGAAVHDRWGRADLWLHTACHAAPLSPAEHVAAKDLDKTLALNVRAFQRMIRVVDPLLRLADAPTGLIAMDHSAGAKFHGAYGASKAAQSALTRSWATEAAAKIAIAELFLPPMPTALRARFFPGEDRASLTPPSTVAADLVARLGNGPALDGTLDLT